MVGSSAGVHRSKWANSAIVGIASSIPRSVAVAPNSAGRMTPGWRRGRRTGVLAAAVHDNCHHDRSDFLDADLQVDDGGEEWV